MKLTSLGSSAHAQSGFLRSRARLAGLSALLVLSACALPDKPVRSTVYDFGAGVEAAASKQQALPAAVALADVEASAALDSTAVLYRLEYADAQQPRPYANARWSMTPALLLQQRLRQRLAALGVVLKPAQAALLRNPETAAPWLLQVELEEFSQSFSSPQSSVGLLRLRATVTQATAQGDKLLGQRSFAVQRPAPQADAAGGVRALTSASDAVVDELLQWLATLRP
jgi:cholesterol transport system auxiliary component